MNAQSQSTCLTLPRQSQQTRNMIPVNTRRLTGFGSTAVVDATVGGICVDYQF